MVLVCILSLLIVFGGSLSQLYFDNAYVVVLTKIVLIILGYGQLCWVYCVGILYQWTSTLGQMHATVILIPVVQKHAMGYVSVV
jgi:hypothetical protein